MTDKDGLLEIIKSRRNTKNFTQDDVPKEHIELLLESAVWAPNHRNTEPWRFFVVPKNSQTRPKIADGMIALQEKESSRVLNESQKSSIKTQILEAPCMLFVYSVTDDDSEITEENYAAVCCAIQNLQLTATAIGLGVGWSTGKVARIENMHKILGAEESLKMTGVLTIGHPEGAPENTRTDYESLTKWL